MAYFNFIAKLFFEGITQLIYYVERGPGKGLVDQQNLTEFEVH
jgi:hypothetical protein